MVKNKDEIIETVLKKHKIVKWTGYFKRAMSDAMDAYASQFPSQGLREEGDNSIEQEAEKYFKDAETEANLMGNFLFPDKGTVIDAFIMGVKFMINHEEKVNATSTPDGSQGLREALEKIKELSENLFPHRHFKKIFDIATEALKK